MPGAFKSSRKAHNARPTKIQPANGLQALVSGARPKPTAHTNGVRKQKGVDESIAQVLGGQSGGDVDMAQEIIEISSASDDDESSAEDDAMTGAQEHVEKGPELPAEDEAADAEELTFGDRLQDLSPTGEPRIVDVEDFDDKPKSTAATNNPLSVPSTSSLGTVLTQALRTNDHELLDTCLRVVDVDSIYATVERLPSPLVGNLISKLAERLHKKPGRAGVLMIWVQWSLAAHGAYLASSPQLVNQLKTLNKVLKERSSGLAPLLALKGRLDMMQAQLELRRRNQKRAANDDEDEAVIYVEGEDDYVSSAEGSVDGDAAPGARKRIRADVDDDMSSIDGMPTTMEMNEDSEDSSEDSEGLIDDEAEETDGDTGDDMSEPMSDDLEGGTDVSESEEESQPARRSTAARTGLTSRR